MNAASTGLSGQQAAHPTQGVTVVQVAQPKSKHGFPALLSFFVPGFGQLIKGQLLKAIGIWIAGGIFFALSFVGIGIPLLILLCLWNVYDAYNA